MSGFLMILWQLPQFLLGLLLIRVLGAKEQEAWEHEGKRIRWWMFKRQGFPNRVLAAFSLAHIILVPDRGDSRRLRFTIPHEHGHSIQSRKYGLLYLLIVGLPSAVRHLWISARHNGRTAEEVTRWYYSGWPELQADRLGKVPARWGVADGFGLD